MAGHTSATVTQVASYGRPPTTVIRMHPVRSLHEYYGYFAGKSP